MEKLTYEDSGVSIERSDRLIDKFCKYLEKYPKPQGLVSGIGGFAACISLKSIISNMEDPCIVTCTDGIGTKLKLALDWNYVDFLGEDLVAMNVNDLICVGANPCLFLDYYASRKLNEEFGFTILKSIHKACSFAGCSLVGGETAEMPGIYLNNDFDLAGFAVGFVDRKNILGAEKVKINDVIIGIESSGIHSNGYSLIRKIVEKNKIIGDDYVPFDKSKTWREILLAPTLIYAPYVHGIYDKIHAIAHITGGGVFGNLPRVLPKGSTALLYSRNWPKIPLFEWLKNISSLSTEEMLSTFNCGIGLIVILAGTQLHFVSEHFKKQGVKFWELGKVKPFTQREIEWL